MIAVLTGLIATLLAGARAFHHDDDSDARTGPQAEAALRTASAVAIASAAALVVCAYFTQLSIVQHAARAQIPFPRWFSALPLIAIEDRAPYYGHAPIANGLGLCCLIETAALAWLYVTARSKTIPRTGMLAIGVASLAMIAGSLLTPAVTSYDMYAYAGAAHVPNPYRPPAQAFDGSFSSLNRIYGVPIFPTPYGPVWVAFSRVTLSALPALGLQLAALRLIEVGALAACLLALRRLGCEAATLALVALNPALLANFVLDGHNDLFALALVLWGMALAESDLPIALTLGILAANVKLPFLLIAPLIFGRIEPRRRRLTHVATVLAGGIALSLLAGGRDYAFALRATTRLYSAFADPVTTVLHALLAAAAIACTALAIVGRRYVPTGAWAFAGIGATFFGWYLPWGLPYAVLEGAWLAGFLLSLPALSFFLATYYAATPLVSWSLTFCAIAAPLGTYLALRAARAARPAKASNPHHVGTLNSASASTEAPFEP